MTGDRPTELSSWRKLPAQAAQWWVAMPNKAFFGGALLLWLLLFHWVGNSTFGYIKDRSLFSWMLYVFNSSQDDGHGLIIPFVVLGLFWMKREELMAVPKRLWWGGLWLVAVAVLLHLVGFMVQQNRISIVGLFLGAYGIIGMAWGPKFLRASFFPYFLFIFCVPLATVADSLTFPLRLIVSTISAGFSRGVLGINVIRDGTQLIDAQGGFQYDVAAACSGLRSLTVLLALTTIYGFLTFRSSWKRALMAFLAVPIAVLGNVIRIVGVIITSEAFGEKAGMRFHDSAGFVVFLVALVCLLVFGAWLREEKLEEKPA